MAAFHSTPMHDPGPEEFQRPDRVCVCKGASVLPCLLSCCCWRRRSSAVQRSRLRAAPPPGACPPESPWCRPVVAARRACQWRRGTWSRACATRRSDKSKVEAKPSFYGLSTSRVTILRNEGRHVSAVPQVAGGRGSNGQRSRTRTTRRQRTSSYQLEKSEEGRC